MKKLFFGIFIIGFIVLLFFKGKDNSTNPLDYSALKYNFTPGEEKIFDLSQTTEISFKNQINTSSVTSFKLSGMLVERTYQVKSDFVILGVKIKEPSFNLQENANFNLLRKELSKEIFLKIDHRGKILNFFFPNGQSLEALNILKSVMIAAQVILPEQVGLNYQLTELNTNGPVQVEYKIIFDKKILIQKTLLKYDFIGFNDLPESEIIFLPDSKSNSIFDKGSLLKLDYTENTLIDSSGLQVQSSVKTKLSLKENKSFELLSAEEPWSNSQFSIRPIFGGALTQDEKVSNLKKEIGNLKIESLFDNFNKINFKVQDQEAFDSFGKLKSYLVLYPKQIQKVVDQIEYLDPEDPFYENLLSVYFGAIATMEAKFAQEYLWEIILKNPDSSIQIQAFGALADLSRPTKKTQEFLIAYYKKPFIPESKSLAALSLGTLAYMAKNDSLTLAKETSNFLKAELAQATKKEDILTLISSIGNSGDANLIGSLIPYVESQDKDISSSAVIAMENMSGENANNIIKKLLSNNNLKSNALYVLSKSPSSKYQLDLAISFFEKESDPELKIQSLKIISSNSRFFKNEVTQYLDKVKSKDPNPKIRSSALNLLISI